MVEFLRCAIGECIANQFSRLQLKFFGDLGFAVESAALCAWVGVGVDPLLNWAGRGCCWVGGLGGGVWCGWVFGLVVGGAGAWLGGLLVVGLVGLGAVHWSGRWVDWEARMISGLRFYLFVFVACVCLKRQQKTIAAGSALITSFVWH